MLTLPPGIKIYVSTQATDMRNSYDGLSTLVSTQLKQDIFTGHLFIFFNRGADRIKILYWDRNGYCIWMKRLEKGRFRCPRVTEPTYTINAGELNLLLEGIDLTHPQRLRPL